jgi:hypothetical protein
MGVRFLIISVALLLLNYSQVLADSRPPFFSCDPKGDCTCNRDDRELHRVEVSVGVPPRMFSVEIAREHFDRRFRPPTKSRDLLLRVLVDSFEPWPDTGRPVLGKDGCANMLLMKFSDTSPIDGSKIPVLDAILLNAINRISSTPVTDLSALNETELVSGLREINLNRNLKSPYVLNEIYIRIDKEKKIDDLIYCRPHRKKLNSDCQHYISFGFVEAKLTYNREELPKWKNISEGARQFLQCSQFKVKS